MSTIKKTVKLKDIAQTTGYSVATVSKVLHGRTDISEKARESIKSAIAQSGYAPLHHASTTQTPTIEVVSEVFDSIWSYEILMQIMSAARDHGLSVTTTESGNRQHPDIRWIDDILLRNPMGAILIFSNLSRAEKKRLHSQNIPFVILDPSVADLDTDNYSIRSDNWTGGFIATMHLIKMGHKRIGIIKGSENLLCTHARFDGYSAALTQSGILPDSDLVQQGDYNVKGGYESAMALLQLPQEKRPTAIFASSDLQAMGLYEAARKLHIRIPDDLSVIGFDDVQTTQFLGPPLTTIKQPLRKMAQDAVRLIFAQHNNEEPESKEVVLPVTLIQRESVRDLNAEA